MLNTISKKPVKEKYKFKSEGEFKIARFLDRIEIGYKYEHPVLVIVDDKPKIWHPDFRLPEYGIYIEYYGLAGDPDYDRGIKKKTEVYKEMEIQVIPIFPSDFEGNWEGKIMSGLLEITSNKMSDLNQKVFQNKEILLNYQDNSMKYVFPTQKITGSIWENYSKIRSIP